MGILKKKVSFDIEPNLLDDIKKYCAENNIKQSNFFRESAKEKLSRDKNYLTILVPTNEGIEKFVVNKQYYDLDMFEASQKMKEIVNAKQEGVLRLKNEYFNEANPKLKKIVKAFGKVAFFVR